jgi:hypothetical protein
LRVPKPSSLNLIIFSTLFFVLIIFRVKWLSYSEARFIFTFIIYRLQAQQRNAEVFHSFNLDKLIFYHFPQIFPLFSQVLAFFDKFILFDELSLNSPLFEN